MEGNLLVNFVKESNDHAAFNSWDRQPFVFRFDEYDLSDTAELRISPLKSYDIYRCILNQ
jgi:hypothetical protein